MKFNVARLGVPVGQLHGCPVACCLSFASVASLSASTPTLSPQHWWRHSCMIGVSVNTSHMKRASTGSLRIQTGGLLTIFCLESRQDISIAIPVDHQSQPCSGAPRRIVSELKPGTTQVSPSVQATGAEAARLGSTSVLLKTKNPPPVTP